MKKKSLPRVPTSGNNFCGQGFSSLSNVIMTTNNACELSITLLIRFFVEFIPRFNGDILLVIGDVPSIVRRL